MGNARGSTAARGSVGVASVCVPGFQPGAVCDDSRARTCGCDYSSNACASQGIERLLGDLHTSVVSGADNEQLGLLGQDGRQVLPYQTVSLPAPPALLDMVGKDDDVGVVAAALDVDVAEMVLVDTHGSISRRPGR